MKNKTRKNKKNYIKKKIKSKKYKHKAGSNSTQNLNLSPSEKTYRRYLDAINNGIYYINGHGKIANQTEVEYFINNNYRYIKLFREKIKINFNLLLPLENYNINDIPCILLLFYLKNDIEFTLHNISIDFNNPIEESQTLFLMRKLLHIYNQYHSMIQLFTDNKLKYQEMNQLFLKKLLQTKETYPNHLHQKMVSICQKEDVINQSNEMNKYIRNQKNNDTNKTILFENRKQLILNKIPQLIDDNYYLKHYNIIRRPNKTTFITKDFHIIFLTRFNSLNSEICQKLHDIGPHIIDLTKNNQILDFQHRQLIQLDPDTIEPEDIRNYIIPRHHLPGTIVNDMILNFGSSWGSGELGHISNVAFMYSGIYPYPPTNICHPLYPELSINDYNNTLNEYFLQDTRDNDTIDEDVDVDIDVDVGVDDNPLYDELLLESNQTNDTYQIDGNNNIYKNINISTIFDDLKNQKLLLDKQDFLDICLINDGNILLSQFLGLLKEKHIHGGTIIIDACRNNNENELARTISSNNDKIVEHINKLNKENTVDFNELYKIGCRYSQ